MIAGLFIFTGKQYVELCRHCAEHLSELSHQQSSHSARRFSVGYNEEARRAQQCIDKMVEAVKLYGWDGEWYLRAYDYYGNKIGSSENEEGKIFIESQGFCTMAGIGLEDGMVDKSLDSCKRLLDCEHGMVLNYPAFTRYHMEASSATTILGLLSARP